MGLPMGLSVIFEIELPPDCGGFSGILFILTSIYQKRFRRASHDRKYNGAIQNEIVYVGLFFQCNSYPQWSGTFLRELYFVWCGGCSCLLEKIILCEKKVCYPKKVNLCKKRKQKTLATEASQEDFGNSD